MSPTLLLVFSWRRTPFASPLMWPVPSAIHVHTCAALPLWTTLYHVHAVTCLPALPKETTNGNQMETTTWGGEKGSGLHVLLRSVKKARGRTSCLLEQEPRERRVTGKKSSKGIETWVPIYTSQMTSSQSASDPAPVADSLTGDNKYILKGMLSLPFEKENKPK